MAKNQKTEPAIEICNIKKSFIIPKYNNNSLKQIIVNGWKRNEKQVHKVLDDISFVINKGDFFGIVGRNGSGKSTLLKTICGVYAPDGGEIKLHGNLTPFIELGVGFNPELSGRDNVFLNGALLGFSRQQMNKMYDEIVKFAELEEFMDLKLKNYSSGMQVRLAFSIAIKAKNDILVFDEVLAVGDEAFQRKCLDVFEEYKANGQTIVLVTHDMDTVKKFCNKAALIHDGKIVQIGNPIMVADQYSALNEQTVSGSLTQEPEPENIGDKIIKAVTMNKNNSPKKFFEVYDEMVLEIKWEKNKQVKTVMVDMFKNSGEHVTGFKMFEDEIKKLKVNFTKRDSIKVKIPLNFMPGKYYFQIGIRKNMDDDLWTNYRVADFVIKKPNYVLQFSGIAPTDKQWIID